MHAWAHVLLMHGLEELGGGTRLAVPRSLLATLSNLRGRVRVSVGVRVRIRESGSVRGGVRGGASGGASAIDSVSVSVRIRAIVHIHMHTCPLPNLQSRAPRERRTLTQPQT